MKRFIVTVDQRVRFQYEVLAKDAASATTKIARGKVNHLTMTKSPHYNDISDFHVIDTMEITQKQEA